jgi:pimeloyl-ACP methyl ester carboxylesterase
MLGGITQFANWTVGNALGVYYGCASHRSLPDLPSISSVDRRPLHFFRGMLHFEPASPFLGTLRAYGFQPEVFRFPREGEINRLRQWRENTGDVLRHFIESPDALGERPVLCGHSAGGLTVYTMAALAKGGNASAIRDECPGLEGVPTASLEALGARLAEALFVSIASPLQGVRLTRVGRCMNRLFVEPRLPLLLSGITAPNLEAYYRRVRRRPDQVIDANLVSHNGTPAFHGGVFSKVSSRVIQGGMRVFSPFLDHESVNDGIVPLDAAVLHGPAQVFAAFDHLKLVETQEAAMVLVDLIRQAEASRHDSVPLSRQIPHPVS